MGKKCIVKSLCAFLFCVRAMLDLDERNYTSCTAHPIILRVVAVFLGSVSTCKFTITDTNFELSLDRLSDLQKTGDGLKF